jgi:hypothetical protein
LSTYLTGGFSCTLEDKTLSGFTYTQTSGAPSPTVVTIAPETGVLHSPALVFNFTGVLTVPTGSTVTIPFGFDLTAPASDPVTDAALTVAGTVTGAGSITDDETLNEGAVSALRACIGVAGCASTASASFGAVTNVTVLDSAILVGAASDPIITKVFSETPSVVIPEPATLALLGALLGTLGLARWRC